MESRNPILSRRNAFSSGGASPSVDQLEAMYNAPSSVEQSRMTLDSVVLRTAITLGVLVASGAVAWVLNLGIPVMIVAALAGFVLALVVIFKRVTSPPLVLAYAAAEGLALGVISHLFESLYSGIVTQAVLGTVAAFAAMLAAYSTRLIRVTPKFTKIVIAAGGGLVLLMLVNLVSYLFLPQGIGIRTDSVLGIAFSLVALVVGCLFLALDFDMIEKGIAHGAPEKESWLAAFGLTLTLVWIYLEILRLLSYFRGD